jgi:hypothetical protein
MRAWAWAVLAVAGFALMIVSFGRWLRLDPEAPWAAGYLAIGSGEPAEKPDVGTILATRLRFLPLSPMADSMVKGAEASMPDRGPVLRARIRRKLIELPPGEVYQLVGWLREGRMPEAGRDEVLAGSEWKLGEEIVAGGKNLRVVGVLRPSVALFADSALAAADRSVEPAFAAEGPDLNPVHIIRLSSREAGDRKVHQQLERAFPAPKFALLRAEVRSNPTGYLAYLAAQVLFLIGGTGLLISFYRWLAGRVRRGPLAEPLGEIAARPRLIWGTHIAYFGLYMLGALLIRQNTTLHDLMMTAIQHALTSKQGPLAEAGTAYLSGSRLWAALVTFRVNFFLGTLLMITLPALIIPGSGALVAAFRAGLWGILLGPATVTVAAMMIPHSGTLLLEGEGYILATFFALLVPIRLFGPGRPASKPNPTTEPLLAEAEMAGEEPLPAVESIAGRYVRAIGLNVKALILVAAVLAVAACYEAVEVLWMAGL